MPKAQLVGMQELATHPAFELHGPTPVRPAHAYLDANTGSLLVQLLVGGIAGLALVGKLFWHRLKGFFGFSRSEAEEDRPTQ